MRENAFLALVCMSIMPGNLVFGTNGTAAAQATVKGENLIPGDSSFETEATKSCLKNFYEGSVTWRLDSAEKYDGRQSLKLWCPKTGSAARTAVRGDTRAIPISTEQADHSFTFSVYAKADQDGVSGKLGLVQANWSHGIWNKFNLSREWKRYSVTGKLKAGEYWVGLEASGSNSFSVWLDAFQLEQDDRPTAYRNRDINLGVDIPSEHRQVFFQDEPVRADIRALVHGEAGGELPFSYRISDYFYRTVREEKKEMRLDNEGYGKEEVVLSGLNPGFYAVRAELETKKGKAENLSTFVVVRPPVEIEKGKTPFCGILTEAPGQNPDRLGSKWRQALTTWGTVEKEKGRYDWSNIDRMIADNPGKNRLKLSIAWLPSAPKWTWDKAEIADCEARKIKPDNLLPAAEHLAGWREFVHRFAERYKDRADVIEVGAEDETFAHNPYYLAKYKEDTTNGWLAAGPAFDRYLEMVSIACREIKKSAPDVKIGIIRPWECANYYFSKAVLRQGGTNIRFDAFPLDCYTSPRNIGPGQPAAALPENSLPGKLQGALDMCREYAEGQPIYISEYGVMLDMTVPPDSEYAHEMVKRLTRSHLIAKMTRGVEFFHWFVYEGCVHGKYEYGIWNGYPLPSAAAYSAMARVVENVEETKDIFPKGITKAVAFQKRSQADAAIWLVKGQGRAVLHNVPANLAITDVMGAPMPAERNGGTTTIAIGEEPVYLNLAAANIFDKICDYLRLPDKNSFDRLCGLLASADLRVTPVQIQLAVPRIDRGLIILHNQATHDLIAGVACEAGNVAATNELPVAKGKTARMEFALPAGITEHEEKVFVTADCGGQFEKVKTSFSLDRCVICRRIKNAAIIGGACGAWQGQEAMVLNNREQLMPPDQLKWQGTNDLSAIVRTGWDETNFYFAAEVRDNRHVNEKIGAEIWNGDSVQMAFAPLAASDIGIPGYGASDTELILALANGKAEASKWHGPGDVRAKMKYSVHRDEAAGTTYYHAGIPWSALGIKAAPGTVFGFNFVIFDDDTGAGPVFWYQLSPGITGGKNPALFKRFVLSE